MFCVHKQFTMWRTAVRLTPTFIFPIFTHNRNENDYNQLDRKVPTEPETGWERVKKMYSRDEYNEVTVELHNVIQASLCGAFIGVALGGFKSSREAYLYFIENNQATIFKSTAEAKKKLQDHVTIGFAKGAYRWGWRLSFFTGMFSLIATTVSVYRNETSMVDYITAGAISGALYKANLGAAACLVGAGLGAVLSAIGGGLILGVLKITGISMADVRQALYKIKEARVEQYNQAWDKSATERNDNLTRHHDKLVEEKGAVNIEELNS